MWIWTGKSNVKDHVETVGKHLHPFRQSRLKFTSILGGAPKTGILYKPVKNFISFSSLMDEFSVKSKRKVYYTSAVPSSVKDKQIV